MVSSLTDDLWDEVAEAPHTHGDATTMLIEYGRKATAILERLVDPDECEYDHHGYCQAHSLHERPCPHEEARGLLTQHVPITASEIIDWMKARPGCSWKASIQDVLEAMVAIHKDRLPPVEELEWPESAVDKVLDAYVKQRTNNSTITVVLTLDEAEEIIRNAANAGIPPKLLDDGERVLAEYEDGSTEIVEYRDNRHCTHGNHIEKWGPRFVSPAIGYLPVDVVRWMRLPDDFKEQLART